MNETETFDIVEESASEKARKAAGPYGDTGIVAEPDTDDNAKSNEPYGDDLVAEPDTDDNAKPNEPYGDDLVAEPDTDDNAKSNEPYGDGLVDEPVEDGA